MLPVYSSSQNLNVPKRKKKKKTSIRTNTSSLVNSGNTCFYQWSSEIFSPLFTNTKSDRSRKWHGINGPGMWKKILTVGGKRHLQLLKSKWGAQVSDLLDLHSNPPCEKNFLRLEIRTATSKYYYILNSKL